MSITSEMREYFENLTKVLVSTESLEELLSSLQEKIFPSLKKNTKSKIKQ